MKDLLYIGYFDTIENQKESRHYTPSAANKMSYICSAIIRAGWDVTIISPSVTTKKKCCKGKTMRLKEHLILKLFFSFGTRCKVERILRYLCMQIQLFFYLFFNTYKGQPVLVYHSLVYMRLIHFLKKIKKFKLILEVEEIYADVLENDKIRLKELNFFKYADSFLFATELLNDVVNISNKPFVIVYGTYQVEECYGNPIEDGKIHCVYAGTFDPRKGGAQTAIATALRLPQNYYVHIIGFGSKEQISSIKLEIELVSSLSKAQVSYDGLLHGTDYVRLLQSCQIGLSTQIPIGTYNETSFPSKVLSYLANGMRVVAARLKVLERSSINGLLYYYDENTSESIANAIKSIDFDADYDSRKVVENLDKEFVKRIGILIDGIVTE